MPVISARAAIAALQAFFVISLVWSAGFLAWVSLAAVDFAYPLLYDVMDIDGHIEHYGPQNRFKSGFESTSREEQLALFAGINVAVHHGGRGLAELSYIDRSGERVQLLREPERIHLESVARLIDRLAWASWLMLAALAASVAALWRWHMSLPAPRRVLAATLIVIAVAAIAVLAIGPERVFNTLHTWVFPAGEQWYFFYQESLMTTLMKAPDLFGAIAVLLVLLGLVYFMLGLLASRLLLRRTRFP